MFLIKCLGFFFPSVLGGFPDVDTAGQRVSAATERKKSKAGGKRKQKRGGKKNKDCVFLFLLKLNQHCWLFPAGKVLSHYTLCVRSSTGQAQRYRCWQLGQVSSVSAVPTAGLLVCIAPRDGVCHWRGCRGRSPLNSEDAQEIKSTLETLCCFLIAG